MDAKSKADKAMEILKSIEKLEAEIQNARNELVGLFEVEHQPTVTGIIEGANGTGMPTTNTVMGQLQGLLKSEPGKRFHINDIKASLPANTSILALRKALFRITREVKGFARDKHSRGVYYYKG